LILKSIVCLFAHRLMIISSIQSMEYLMHDLFHEIFIGDISPLLNPLTHLKSINRNKKMSVSHWWGLARKIILCTDCVQKIYEFKCLWKYFCRLKLQVKLECNECLKILIIFSSISKWIRLCEFNDVRVPQNQSKIRNYKMCQLLMYLYPNHVRIYNL